MPLRVYKEKPKTLSGTFPQAVYDFMDSVRPNSTVVQTVEADGQVMTVIGCITATSNYGACLVITNGAPLRQCVKNSGKWSYETYTKQ